jgi:hypothetical protein
MEPMTATAPTDTAPRPRGVLATRDRARRRSRRGVTALAVLLLIASGAGSASGGTLLWQQTWDGQSGYGPSVRSALVDQGGAARGDGGAERQRSPPSGAR